MSVSRRCASHWSDQQRVTTDAGNFKLDAWRHQYGVMYNNFNAMEHHPLVVDSDEGKVTFKVSAQPKEKRKKSRDSDRSASPSGGGRRLRRRGKRTCPAVGGSPSSVQPLAEQAAEKVPQPLAELALQVYFQWQRQWHAEYRRVRIRRSHERFLEFRERHKMLREDTLSCTLSLHTRLSQLVAMTEQQAGSAVAAGISPMAAPRRQLGAVILASLPLIGSSERSLMATRGFEGSLVQLSEGMVSSDTLLQFVLVVIALATAMGFVLGLWCASRFPGPPAAVVRSAARTLGTQSQCTYKRHWATPRFYVLPPASDGVFIDG